MILMGGVLCGAIFGGIFADMLVVYLALKLHSPLKVPKVKAELHYIQIN